MYQLPCLPLYLSRFVSTVDLDVVSPLYTGSLRVEEERFNCVCEQPSVADERLSLISVTGSETEIND